VRSVRRDQRRDRDREQHTGDGQHPLYRERSPLDALVRGLDRSGGDPHAERDQASHDRAGEDRGPAARRNRCMTAEERAVAARPAEPGSG
jgi:hypothetical protein